jgi:hypothetical protein
MRLSKGPRVLNDRGTWRIRRAKLADLERRRFKEDTGFSNWGAVRAALRRRDFVLASASQD